MKGAELEHQLEKNLACGSHYHRDPLSGIESMEGTMKHIKIVYDILIGVLASLGSFIARRGK